MAQKAPEKNPAERVIERVFAQDEEYQAAQIAPAMGMPDFIFAHGESHNPEDIFTRLRWGGLYVFADPSPAKVRSVAEAFRARGFLVADEPASIPEGWKWWPLIRRKLHFVTARKVLHVLRGNVTNRFTFEVQLSMKRETHPSRFVVTKRIPSSEWVINRLRIHAPNAPEEELESKAQWLISDILPVFLTREIGLMKRLHDHLPFEFRDRVPRLVHFERDSRGLVNLLQVNWLRNGGKPISQIDFAIQASEVLAAVHDYAGVAHLDLRQDNMVVTPKGVGIIDFGNSVNEDEDLSKTPSVQKIFADLMHTTQVQKALAHAINTGHVTSPWIKKALHKPDKALDIFFLAYQFITPHDNPDLRDFIIYRPGSDEDVELKKMVHRLYSPGPAEMEKVYGARHLARAIKMIKARLESASTPVAVAT